MILVSKENFKKYLKENGFKEFSEAGNETTIHSYIYWIERVMQIENIETWSELTEHIQLLLRKYGEYGEMKQFGKEAHSTVINALNRFMEYLLNECSFIPKTGIYFN